MRDRTIKIVTIAAAISLVIGLAVGFYAMHVHHEMQKRSSVIVWVARANYPAHVQIHDVEGMFERKEWPLLETPPDMVSPLSPIPLERNSLRKPLKQGDVLVMSNLERPDLDMTLTQGSRALTIAMDAAPQVQPGTRCAVLHKERRDGKDQEPKVLLADARVHAIARGDGMSARVTVEVAPDQVLTLLAAQQSGTILLKPVEDKAK